MESRSQFHRLTSFVEAVPQIVPESWCLTCKICCRFPAEEGVQTPTWSAMEADWARQVTGGSAVFRKESDESPSLLPRLVQDESGCHCPAFLRKTNSCSIYSVRPLDCRLYPFVLTRDAAGTRVVLALDRKCPYVQAHELDPELSAYATQLARYLEDPVALEYVKTNPNIVGHFWPEFVSVAPLPALAASFKTQHPPPHPALGPFTWEDRPLLEERLALGCHSSSLYTASSIFGWSDLIRYWQADLEGTWCLFAEQGGGLFMPLPPLGTSLPESALRAAWEILSQANNGSDVSRIEGVEPHQVEQFLASGFRLLPGEEEYLYRRDDLVSLRGDRYRSQRALVNRCLKERDVRIRPFEDPDLVSCLALYTAWGIRRQRQSASALSRSFVRDGLFFHRRLMMSHRELGLSGRVAQVNGQVRGYTFGAPVSSNAFCIFLEIADRDMRGLAQTLFREFCRQMNPFHVINAMGDGGLPGLRQAKQLYRPTGFVQPAVAVKRKVKAF